MMRQLLPLALILLASSFCSAFVAPSLAVSRRPFHRRSTAVSLSSDDSFLSESEEDVQERIGALVEAHPVILFMKGSKLFPQCGFSNNAVQILNSYNVEYHTVDVLSDNAIREGVKIFSQWPTIPQLYVDGEFIGGSDIMIEMYQSGELGELIEKAMAA